MRLNVLRLIERIIGGASGQVLKEGLKTSATLKLGCTGPAFFAVSEPWDPSRTRNVPLACNVAAFGSYYEIATTRESRRM